MITLEEVKDSVAAIEYVVDDDEAAHCLEDDLYLKILKHHESKGCKLSKEALKVSKMNFSRCCG